LSDSLTEEGYTVTIPEKGIKNELH
jgi:hypothetical protein